jgi:uncharacterized protein YpiB (UPF0302 family)
MSDDDIHPFIVKNTDNQSLSLDDLTGHSVVNFVCMHPNDRKQILDQIDTALQADDGVHLRKKAQLLSLSRTLSTTHAEMRRTGR